MKNRYLFLLLAGGLLSCKDGQKSSTTQANAPTQTASATTASGDTIILNNEVYAILAGGLSVREKPDANAAVIGKIEYGAVVELPPVPTDGGLVPQNNSVPVNLAGMATYWIKAQIGGKTGYVIEAYVSDYPPPPAGTKDLKGWAQAISKPYGAAFVSQSKTKNFYQDGIDIYRQLYNNGGVYSESVGYEYFATSLQLPNTTLLKVLNCLRGLEDFAPVFKANAPLKKGSYTVPDTQMPEGYQWVTTYDATGQYLQAVSVSWSDGGYSTITVTQLETDVIVSFSSGV